MAYKKIATYSDIINAGGNINSGISYTLTKCVSKNAIISNFSNVSLTAEGASKLDTQLININEFNIVLGVLTGIETKTSYTKGSGGTSTIKITATYSDGTLKDVTSLCVMAITNASTTGVATLNSSTLTISHGAQGTATLNVGYTENGVTKTTTAQIITTPVFPIGYTISPNSVIVDFGKTVNVSVIGHLNNDNNASSGFLYSYANTNASSYFSFNTISGGIAVSGTAAGTGDIMVGWNSGLGATIKIPVTVIPQSATKELVIEGDSSISTIDTKVACIYFKAYDTYGNELSSTNITNDCTVSVNNYLLTIKNNDIENKFEFVSGATEGTSTITATYTYDGVVYTATHDVSITYASTSTAAVIGVSMIEVQYNDISPAKWVMAVELSNGSTIYPLYNVTCTASQIDASYTGGMFSGPLTYTKGSSNYAWSFTATSTSSFYSLGGDQFHPSSSGTIYASSTWRPS